MFRIVIILAVLFTQTLSNHAQDFTSNLHVIHKDISLHTVLWQTENLHSIPQLNFSITNFT